MNLRYSPYTKKNVSSFYISVKKSRLSSEKEKKIGFSNEQHVDAVDEVFLYVVFYLFVLSTRLNPLKRGEGCSQ